MPKPTNYWLAKNGSAGNGISFKMTFACPTFIYGFHIKNTNNADREFNYGTKNFSISTLNEDGSLSVVVSGTLPNGKGEASIPTMKFPINGGAIITKRSCFKWTVSTEMAEVFNILLLID